MSFITLNKFMNAFSNYPNFDKVKNVSIYFNDCVSDKFEKSKYNIKLLAIYFDDKYISFNELWDRFPDFKYLAKITDRFFNTLPLVKTLCKMTVENKLIKNDKYSYYKKSFVKIGNDNKVKQFEKLISETRVERFKKTVDKICEGKSDYENDEEFFDSDF